MKCNYSVKTVSIVLIAFLSFNLLSSCCCCSPDMFTGNSKKTPVAIKTPSENTTNGNHEEVDEKTVTVDALYYVATKPPGGGTSEVTIKIAPNPKGELRVGFFEEEVGGTGNMWRSSGWMGVVLATMLLGKDATDYEFSISVGGRIDGPSAGALMTVGLLAALRGKDVKKDATMTGTINPDGTIGPVGGIPQKLYGAAKKGKKLVLIPVGERYCLDMATKTQVDVVEKGRKIGIQVKEVSNIYDAYNLLTGDTIPLHSTSTGHPQLPPKAFERMKGKAKEWYSRYQKSRSEFKALPQEYQQYCVAYVNHDDAMASKSNSALSQGMACVAYDRAYEAAISMEALVLTLNMVKRYYETYGQVGDIVDYLESKQSVKTELSGFLDRLKAEDLKTASDYVTLFTAYGNLGIAKGCIVIGDDKVSQIVKYAKNYTPEQLISQLFVATICYTVAGSVLQQAKDALDVGKGIGTAPAIKNKNEIRKLADVISGASKANMAYFESTIIDQYAQAYGQHPNKMKDVFMQLDSRYLIATASSIGEKILEKYAFSGKKDAAPMIIGEAATSYTLSAQLIAKYYSLDTKLDKSLTKIVSIGKERALADMLDFADKRAVEMIHLNGEENSVIPIFYYENARMSRQGTPEDQIEALGYYWVSTLMSELQAYMSGKLGEN